MRIGASVPSRKYLSNIGHHLLMRGIYGTAHQPVGAVRAHRRQDEAIFDIYIEYASRSVSRLSMMTSISSVISSCHRLLRSSPSEREFSSMRRTA